MVVCAQLPRVIHAPALRACVEPKIQRALYRRIHVMRKMSSWHKFSRKMSLPLGLSPHQVPYSFLWYWPHMRVHLVLPDGCNGVWSTNAGAWHQPGVLECGRSEGTHTSLLYFLIMECASCKASKAAGAGNPALKLHNLARELNGPPSLHALTHLQQTQVG